MARPLTFDARFVTTGTTGQTVDADLYVEIYEEGATVYKERRVIGAEATNSILKTTDAAGVLYTTTVDLIAYIKGDVTAKWYAKLGGSFTSPYPFIEVLPYPYDAILNSTELRDYVRTMLGFPAVAVELTSEHYRTIVEEALAVYNTWLPVEKYGTLTLAVSTTAYPLPSLPSRGPTTLSFVRQEGTPLISDPLFGREYPRGQQLDFDQYVLGISFWETLNRVTSQEPEWVWDASSKTLYINVGGTNIAGASGNYYVMYRYFDNVGIDGIRLDHFRWFRRYCLALAKQILGRIRGKYSGKVPAPGGPLQLDSESLLQEGAQEQASLVEEARSMSPSVPPVLG